MTRATPITIVARLSPAADFPGHRNLLAHLGLRLDHAVGARRGRAPQLSPLPPEDEQAVDAATAQLVTLLNDKLIHFMSFFIIDHERDDGLPKEVVLEINGNAGLGRCCNELATKAPKFVQLLFGKCGAPDGAASGPLARFLRRHDVGADAYHVGCRGRSAPQIHREAALRERMRTVLASASTSGECQGQLWMALQSAARDDADSARLVAEPVKRPWLTRWGLHPRGFRARLRTGFRLLAPPVFAAVALYGFVDAVLHAGRWQLALLVCPLAFALLVALPLFLREAPVHGRRLRSLRAFFWPTLSLTVTAAVVIGALDLLVRMLAGDLVPAPWLRSGAIWFVMTLFLLAASALAYALAGRIAAYAAPLGVGLWWAHVWINLGRPTELAHCALTIAAATTLVAAIWVAWLFIAIRRKELAEETEPVAVDLPRLDAITEFEDWQPQNHLATVTPLKDGRLRRYALRVVLRGVSFLASTYFNHGRLASIACIHFGRFVILENPARLLFLGNYDGGFAAYLGAFSSAPGTTAVWSNTRGFPRTFFLLGEGARDEARFKTFGRASQVPTLGWYSAYPRWSVQDIDAATATREALRRRIGPWQPLLGRLGMAVGLDTLGDLVQCRQAARPRSVAERLAAIVRTPLDETGCDAAVRRL